MEEQCIEHSDSTSKERRITWTQEYGSEGTATERQAREMRKSTCLRVEVLKSLLSASDMCLCVNGLCTLEFRVCVVSASDII